MNKNKPYHPLIRTTAEVAVRFSEVDALGIVWHGHYVKFMEDGREAFGKVHGFGYLDVYAHGFATPIVSLALDYKKTVKYGDSLLVETTYVDTQAAKIIFDYKLSRVSDGAMVATGRTVQVFIDLKHELHITIPPFFEEWKKKHGLMV